LSGTRNDLEDLQERVRDLVERCRNIERQSETSLAAEVLVAARVLAGKVSLLAEAEGGRDAD
jgi:hypothetical protein